MNRETKDKKDKIYLIVFIIGLICSCFFLCNGLYPIWTGIIGIICMLSSYIASVINYERFVKKNE